LNRLQSCNRMTACMLYIPCPICCLVDVDANADTETQGHLPLPCPGQRPGACDALVSSCHRKTTSPVRQILLGAGRPRAL
jgi:hypothetical protein